MKNSSFQKGTMNGNGLPLLAAQSGIWFSQQLNPNVNQNIFKLGNYLEIFHSINEPVFFESVKGAINEFETYRASFHFIDGELSQHLTIGDDWEVKKLDFSAQKKPEHSANEWMKNDSQVPLDLSAGPLFSLALIKLADDHYYFYHCAHHIVIDGYSANMFMQRISEHYLAKLNGEDAEPRNFNSLNEVCEAEKAYEESGQFQRDKAYWQNNLQDAPEPLSLAKQVQPCTGVLREEFALADTLNNTIVQLAQDFKCSIPQLVTALTAIYLYRITKHEDVILGSVMSGRMTRLLRETPCNVPNILPLRIELEGDMHLGECLLLTRRQMMGVMKHQRYRAELIGKDLGLMNEHDVSVPTTINIMPFQYDMSFCPNGTPIKEHVLMRGIVSDLAFTFSYISETSFKYMLEGNLALYKSSDLVMHLNRLFQFIQGVADHRDLPISEFPILFEDEREFVLDTVNQTEVIYPDVTFVHQPIEQQAKMAPDDIAVRFEQESLTYEQLNTQANQLAHHLIGCGVGPDSRVAVCMTRSCELVVSILAVLKAGGAYVPLDPDYPDDRLNYMLKDSQPTAVITRDIFTPRLTGLSDAVQVLDIDKKQGWAYAPTFNPEVKGLAAEHLAYVIYTSGSTGLPKGVMNEHKGVINRLQWMINDYDFNDRDVFLQKTPFSFDVSVWEFFCPLWVGATLLMAKPEGHKDPAYLQACIDQHQVSVVHFVPPMLSVFLDGLEEQTCQSLRLIFCSGEALLASTIRKAYQCLPQINLHNLYGPTEAAVDVTSWTCPKDLVGETVSIGHPVANTQMYVLDEQMNPLPVGVQGELYIGGIQVARGYLNRPELTDERFVADPYSDLDGMKMYRTGDLGCWRDDGTIEYLGRNDDQVKIRGLRIELGEISSAMQDFHSIEEAVVVAFGDGATKYLVGYYTGASVDLVRLKLELIERLPNNMVPSAYVELEALPLTPNGKVDRKALPVPDEEAVVQQIYEAPLGEVECLLAGLWQEILGREKVGRKDHFFELGGHSLLAIKLIQKLRQHGYNLSIRQLFDHPVLSLLASELSEIASKAIDVSVPDNRIPENCIAITPEMLPLVSLNKAEIDLIGQSVKGGMSNIQDIYPLAPLQQGLLFHHMAEKDDPYILKSILSIPSQEGVEKFVDALQTVITRHDILRTAVVHQGLSAPVQVVWRKAPASLIRLTHEMIGLKSNEDVLSTVTDYFDHGRAQMDIQTAPMIQLYQVADPANDRCLLGVFIHHLVGDATTSKLMLDEVIEILFGRADELPTPLPFRNFVAQTIAQENHADEQSYFENLLGDIDTPTAPFGVLERQRSDAPVIHQPLELDNHLVVQIRDIVRRKGMSAAALFHLAWGMVVRAATGQDNIVFGTVLFGRMDGGEGADQVMGMFLNTLPLRLSLADCNVQEALQQSQHRLAELLTHEHASLILAQQSSGLRSDLPLFSTLFNYRHTGGMEKLVKENLLGLDVVYSDEQTNYPLSLSVNDVADGGFTLDLIADSQLNASLVAEMMQTAIAELVQALDANSEKQITALNILPEREIERVIREFNKQGVSSVSKPGLIHQQVEAVALSMPNAIALQTATGSLTYAELNTQANRWAHYLQSLGVEPGSRVALCLDRGESLISSMLAVLKAGAAYVPLDPSYPSERLAYMMADCDPQVLLHDGMVSLSDFGELNSCCTVVDIRPVPGSEQPWLQMCASAPTVSGLSVDHLAYIIYTSGSTGQPKGVMVTHANLHHLVYWHNSTFEVAAETCCSSTAGVGFDAAVWEIWPPLCAGAVLAMPNLAVSRDPEQLLNWWQSQPIEVGFLSTAMAELALSRGQMPSALKTLLVGGDRLTRYPSMDANYTLVNNYGPTEATVVATSGAINHDDTTLHIGYGVDHSRIYILDANQQMLPVGVPGELYIGGQGVAQGYLNQPELTAERFLLDPFSEQTDARMYRTGDLARWREDGTLEYLGRNDDQLKIRGFRIEPGEIEATLQACPGIAEAVVTAASVSGNNGPKQLIAYYTQTSKQPSVDPADLRNQLNAQLPDYMVPSAYVVLDAVPLTANGKVNKRALPVPTESAFASRPFEAPEEGMEQDLAGMWSALIGIDKISRHDHFFELGGHSLLAVQFISRVRQELSVEITMADLFEQPTLSELANLLTYKNLASLDMDELARLAQGMFVNE